MRTGGHGQDLSGAGLATALRRRALVERWHGRTIEQEGQELRNTSRRADRYRGAGPAVGGGAVAVLKIGGLAREGTSDLVPEGRGVGVRDRDRTGADDFPSASGSSKPGNEGAASVLVKHRPPSHWAQAPSELPAGQV